MQIAPQHDPKHWWPKDTDFKPACAWPERCYVQWGSKGVVIKQEGGGYQTAFFEAFPGDNAGGFIRGEGATIGEAEAAAFKKYQSQIGCEHRWRRGKYTNGGAHCANCRAFKSVFKPIRELGWWRKPITYMDNLMLEGEEDREPLTPEWAEARRKLLIRKRLFGVEERRTFLGMEI